MKAKSVILAGLLVLLIPMTASAILIETLPGQTVGGQPVAVSADFAFSTDTIIIAVENSVSNPTSVIQNLNGIGFVLTTGQTSGSLTSSPTDLIYVASNGVAEIVSGTSGWTVQSNWMGTGLLLTAVGTSVWPSHTMIGDPGLGGIYTNANGSIAGNGPHNPFIGDTIFTLYVPGVTAGSSIESAVFFFGTGSDSVAVPEPGTMLLLGIGLIGLAAETRRFKR